MLQERKAFIGVFLIISIFEFSAIVPYEIYGEEAMDKKVIALPKPLLEGKISLEETIQKRRSVRSYSDKDLTIEQISQLLWSAQGITGKGRFRAAPSAGALYPLEIYVVKKDGFFQYRPQGHRLKVISDRDLRKDLANAAWGQEFIAEAPVNIVITAVYERVTSSYGKRGIKYTDIEVGHAAENIHLQAVALGLDSVPVGAFSDDEVTKLLGLSKDETPIYIIPVGYKE